jgi:hypothetical protein
MFCLNKDNFFVTKMTFYSYINNVIITKSIKFGDAIAFENLLKSSIDQVFSYNYK